MEDGKVLSLDHHHHPVHKSTEYQALLPRVLTAVTPGTH